MEMPETIANEDERLPLILGFQRVAENTNQLTRFIEHGKGIYVYDTDGREYIEATSSFYVASLGYQNDELIDAIELQYRELPFFVSGLHRTSKASLDLAEKLIEIIPVPDAHFIFGSSGSEAIDFLIKLLRFGAVARGEPERKTIIGRHGSYHGGTLASASVTGGHHEEFGLPLAGFRHISQADYHGDREPGETTAEYAARCATELETLIAAEPDRSIAALIAEPVSFSAGFKLPPPEYFPTIARVLDAHGIDLVIDEVVTGFGRTGSLFGCETFDLSPAHVTIAKGITSGYFPVSAVGLGRDLYEALETGSDEVGTLAHASTFAAHPVGAAAALKVIEIIERDGLVEHARAMGERLAAGLAPFADHPLVGEVRAQGLAASLDFLRRDADDRIVNDDADDVVTAVYEALLAHGVVTRPAGRNVIIAPPLIIEASEIDEIVVRVGKALDQVEVEGISAK
ncbi:MAG: aminotransferase class III-fold pyridoxal phosphate-dependent enzyme [Gammaproteobacteria bacterium]|jgi:4-aminobutyrate--pyruvate transaminase|nr:aminotransferase class III-fold pyridoxal phosphate-dependent enzyme [Gammaproteobacteria bacterium]HJP36528.1 aminotransferase class III-fold pyridoxal phosphate-dependent enzyme [Gammaproteobacteria bacterium]